MIVLHNWSSWRIHRCHIYSILIENAIKLQSRKPIMEHVISALALGHLNTFLEYYELSSRGNWLNVSRKLIFATKPQTCFSLYVTMHCCGLRLPIYSCQIDYVLNIIIDRELIHINIILHMGWQVGRSTQWLVRGHSRWGKGKLTPFAMHFWQS